MWVEFFDMHSGGQTKLVWDRGKAVARYDTPYAKRHELVDIDRIYIEATPIDAYRYMEEVLGVEPFGVTCDTCGEDYAEHLYDTLEDATAFDRRRNWQQQGDVTLEEYLKFPNILVVRKEEVGGSGHEPAHGHQ
jgi:hypothetical protein